MEIIINGNPINVNSSMLIDRENEIKSYDKIIEKLCDHVPGDSDGKCLCGRRYFFRCKYRSDSPPMDDMSFIEYITRDEFWFAEEQISSTDDYQ